MFNLSTSQPWIAKKYEELRHLVFSDCSNEQQRKLVVDLISRFEYVSNDKYAQSFQEITFINAMPGMVGTFTSSNGALLSRTFIPYWYASLKPMMFMITC